ncbi:MAG: Gldg family protein [Cyanobacteria bacterium J06641_5]
MPVSLLAIGGGLLLVTLLLWSFWKGPLGSRAARAGLNAFVALVAVLGIFGIGNYLAARDAIRYDLTENQLLTLTPQTQALLASVDRPLKVWIFDVPPNPADEQLLANYQRRKADFSFEYADPEREIALVRRFDVQARGEVHIEVGEDRQQLVQIVGENAPLSEVQLSNAIVKALRERVPTLYFLQGHGEAPLEPGEGGLAQATLALQERGYRVETLNLVETPTIPEDADAVALVGPQRPLLEGETQLLQDYLTAGGSLFAAIAPEIEAGLEPLLNDWGIELDDRLVVDASRRGDPIGLGPLVPLVTRYGEHPIVESFGDGLSLYPLSRAVLFAEEVAPDIKAEPLIYTHEETWAESDLTSEELSFDPASDRNGPLTLGYALSRSPQVDDPEESAMGSEKSPEDAEEVPEAAEAPEADPVEEIPDSEVETATESGSSEETATESSAGSRLAIFGSAGFATNGWFDQQLNGDLFLNTIDWLAQADADDSPLLVVRPREQTNRRIALSPRQTRALSLSSIALVPLSGILAAAITWWQRR